MLSWESAALLGGHSAAAQQLHNRCRSPRRCGRLGLVSCAEPRARRAGAARTPRRRPRAALECLSAAGGATMLRTTKRQNPPTPTGRGHRALRCMCVCVLRAWPGRKWGAALPLAAGASRHGKGVRHRPGGGARPGRQPQALHALRIVLPRREACPAASRRRS